MKVFYNQINSYNVNCLIIKSLEQAQYQAHVIIDDEEHLVWYNEHRALTTQNLTQMRERFKCFNIPNVLLRHDNSYEQSTNMKHLFTRPLLHASSNNS